MAIIDKKQKRWYSKSTFDSLDKTTIPVGTEIQVAGELGQADFDSDTNTKLNAVPNKLDKPSGNPTEDSVVKISSTGNVSYKPLSEFGDSGLSLSDIYPIGSIYLSVSSTSPATLFGGTWEQIKDVFLLSAGDTYSAGSTGGESTHTLTIDELAKHSHDIIANGTGKRVGFNEGNADPDYVRNDYTDTGNIGNQYVAKEVGGNQAHNNMPPYLTVYMWKRVS